MTTVAVRHRDRLSDLRRRKSEARERLNRARAEAATAEQAVQATQRGGKITDWPEFRQAELARASVTDAEREIETLRDEETFVLQQAAGVTVHHESFMNDPGRLAQLEQLAYSSAPIGSVNVGQAIDAEQLVSMIQAGDYGQPQYLAAAGDVTVTDTARKGPWQGIRPQLRRPLRLLDFIPSAPGSGSGFDYTQEGGNLDTAVETVEGALKPAAAVTFQDASVKFHTIPHWLKVPRFQLADVPTLQATLSNRLIYGVLRRVESQVISGDGSGENIRGILNTSGIGAPPFSGSVPLSELPLNGITTVILSDAEPTAVVIHPADWQLMVTAKATGSGDYYGAGPFASQVPTLWGYPAILSKAIPAGSALVGDWTQCTLYVRDGVSVRVSDSDADDFLRNRVSLLAEGRYGLAVWAPAGFAVIDLTA